MKYEVSWTEDGKKKSVEKHSYRQAEILACTKPDAEIKTLSSKELKLPQF